MTDDKPPEDLTALMVRMDTLDLIRVGLASLAILHQRAVGVPETDSPAVVTPSND